jgi:hypothetical protein
MQNHYILTNGIITDGFSFIKEDCTIEIHDSKIQKIGESSDFQG